MNRRTFLRAGMAATAAGSAAFAGCTSLFDVQYKREPPIPENRPQAVYYPSHIEGMNMVGMGGMSGMSGMNHMSMGNMSGMDHMSMGNMSGMDHMSMGNMSGMNGSSKMHGNHSDSMHHMTHSAEQMTSNSGYVCALSYTYPHRFWTVTGDRTSKVTIQEEDSVHLMVSLWDKKTDVYAMDVSPTVTISQNDETITTKTLWGMLSQRMGFHAADNVALPGDGTYSVTVDVPPASTRRTGAFEGQFATHQSFEFDFEYSKLERNKIMFKKLRKKAGERGAVDPMNMEMMPLPFAPEKNTLPGRILGTSTNGDAEYVVIAIENASRFGADGKTYLAVSARTPYNRYVLPSMSLSVRVVRANNTVFDGALTATLDPELDYHYGQTVGSLESGDTIEFSVDVPPQVTRHEGYETAFFDIPSWTMTVE